ncbi:unnamed protein product, partial [Coccothraustes coccothraustes]
FDGNICIIPKRFDLDQGLGDLLSEGKALVVPEPDPDSDSNQERRDERERGEALEPAFSFLATLASSASEEIESQLQEGVESSHLAVAQIVTMYDKLREKVDVLCHKLNSGGMTKAELRRAVEEAVKETPEYGCTQSQFSVLYNESLQLKAYLDEARTLLHGTRATHQRQVELIERDEVSLHKKLHTEVIQLEDTLAQVRKEYEMLRVE